MDFTFSEAQRHWHDAAVAFARRELADSDENFLERDRRAEFWRDGLERCARFGFPGLTIAQEHGGQGLDLPTSVAAMEGLGYGCPDSGLIFAINAALWTVTTPIDRFGTPEQKQRYLPGLCSGRLIGANGVSEPEAGSDVFSMRARAEKRGDDWVLNGRKTWITAGPIADVFLCFAATGRADAGALGTSAFLIDRDTPGFRVVRTIPKLGMRTVPMGELALENCVLPSSAMLGREGRGSLIFNDGIELERGAILASALGTMRRQLERCIKHARSRRQFGQPIGAFQSVSNRIVDMSLRLETSRMLVYRFALLRSRGEDAVAAAAMAKLHVSECFAQNSQDAVRIFGAAGYIEETGIERDLRDGVGSLIFSGTNDVQRNIIARQLRLGG